LSRVLLTRRAETDLDDIWLHIALENPVAADGVIDAIVVTQKSFPMLVR